MLPCRLDFYFWICIIAFIFQHRFHVFGQYARGTGRGRGSVIRALPPKRGDQPPPPDEEYSEGIGPELHPLSAVYKVRHHVGYNRNQGYHPAKLHPCEQSSCYPATGNLLIGREDQLYASSTCGLHRHERYCIVSHLEGRKKCFWCDSRPTLRPNPALNHNISNVVYQMYPGTRQKSWWQSENGKEKVYIQLDLEAEFHFTHLIITFKTFRPAAMLIERSYDFKRTWQVYRYFAANCNESFPGIPTGEPKNLNDVVCEERYSHVPPSTGGEVIYRVLPPTLHIDNPYSEEVQNLLKMTNLRINFTKLHTLGDDLLDKREEIQEKYYYAITDMVVRGSCSCYGHANRCLPLSNKIAIPDMVHGRCECTHNTKGKNCEKCEDFFNDLPWRPAIGKQTNACNKCNCNNHATSCHFDAALYESTGRVSGGVCDGCLHNTMGANCEQCKPYFYRDPTRDIQDPEVCRQCDCDPHGALDSGICDSVADPANNLVAGACHCKTNVEGRRCDTCKNGFWNFTEANPDGCQPCTCNIQGTIDNQGCNVYTGECTCKRYVTGRDCNQCLPEYFGLSEKKDGCQPCDCDPGGALDNYCDVITGQCKCREHMSGRTCSTPQQAFFTASLDFIRYEAELAKASSNCQVVIREPYRDGRPDTWTGTGYIKLFENSFIEFIIPDIQKTMDYKIVVRYEPVSPDRWSDLVVTVIRPGPPDPNGPCAHYPITENHLLKLPPNQRSMEVPPAVCLEAGIIYKIKLEFRRTDPTQDPVNAAVLIDSIVIMPSLDKIPWFDNSAAGIQRRKEFEANHCNDQSYYFNSVQAPEICKKYYNSIGAYIFNKAFSCQCDPTGSPSKFCDKYGGSCSCKVNVVGRKCDRCAPGTYGFGPEGCKACECDSVGSLDNYCNATTGQCKCRANTYGRECNQCRIGFWNFPNCVRCDCNGHADTCDSKTGACISCRDNTQGHTCERCIEGYYGDPRLNVDIPCRPCPCPGSIGTNHSFAERCSLDPTTKDVICECQEGYSGSRCDVCSDNYFGNPEVPGGFCQPCDCNDKIDPLKPGNCDPHSGQCKQCLFETTGDHCEVCRPGYFRYTKDSMCEECVCHPLGTNSTSGPCDPESGQCPCLPNVTGLKCDQCIDNHWKIASGAGCESCDCDPQGSLHTQCNEYDGQCACKPGFGGRQCNECMAGFYGDPKLECKECRCDMMGSINSHCDMKTGQCKCRPGIGGHTCDRCARGYLGQSPYCTPCGECFDNWDRILQETENRTVDVMRRASEMKKIGATGAYTMEFENMQTKLDEIEQLLNNTNDVNVDVINKELENLRTRVNLTEQQKLKALDDSLAGTQESLFLTQIKINDLKNRIDSLNNTIKLLEKNATKILEGNVQGALTLIKNAKAQADTAAHKAEHIQETVDYAERQCKATESLLNQTQDKFKETQILNKDKLDNITSELDKLQALIPDLNEKICDFRGLPCDPVCGGAGCNSCGNSISCGNGAKQQAESAVSIANSTEIALRNKEVLANDFIRNISQINTNETRRHAEATHRGAQKALNNTKFMQDKQSNLSLSIKEFLSKDNITPDDIKKVADEVFALNVHLEPDEIKDLTEKIRKTVKQLNNIQNIIEATRDDLARVNALKEKAEYAKLNATKLLHEAETVNKALENTTAAQEEAKNAIEQAARDKDTVNKSLEQIETATKVAQIQTNKTADNIRKLDDKLNQLQRNITGNKIFANRILNETKVILQNAEQADNNFKDLRTKYNSAKGKLSINTEKVQSLSARVSELLRRAFDLKAKMTKTEEDINKLENSSLIDPSDLENQLQDLIRRMAVSTEIIENRDHYYKICV